MINLNLIKNISGAIAPGRGFSSAPWNIFSNPFDNSQKVKSGQSGRSMIEMLGVLAIIGVLSVGGIAGYSKAMQKYRINKTIEQITLITGNVRAFFAPQRSYEGVSDSTILRKAKIVPDEMWNNGEIQNVWGGLFNISLVDTGFAIFLGNLQAEICIEIATQNWENAGLVGMYVNSWDKLDAAEVADNDCEKDSVNDGYFCLFGKTLPVTLDNAVNNCTCTENDCTIVMGFK